MTSKQPPEKNHRMLQDMFVIFWNWYCTLTTCRRSKRKGPAEPQPDQPPQLGQQHHTEPKYDPTVALSATGEGIIECAAEVTKAKTRPPAAPPPPFVTVSGPLSDLIIQWPSQQNTSDMYAPIIDPEQPINPESTETPSERAYDPKSPSGIVVSWLARNTCLT